MFNSRRQLLLLVLLLRGIKCGDVRIVGGWIRVGMDRLVGILFVICWSFFSFLLGRSLTDCDSTGVVHDGPSRCSRNSNESIIPFLNNINLRIRRTDLRCSNSLTVPLHPRLSTPICHLDRLERSRMDCIPVAPINSYFRFVVAPRL